MRKINLLLLLALFTGLRTFGAAGDWIGFAVETNGWVLNCYASGLTTNGTFNLGWSTNINIATSNPKLIVTHGRPGFSNGQEVSRKKFSFGGSRMRFPVPHDAFSDVVYDAGSDITRIRISLSDAIHSTDTAITVTALPGIYTAGTATASATSVTATNLSTLVSPKVVGNWLRRGWRIEDEANMELRFVAFHQSADEMQPVDSVEFYVTDGTVSYTNLVTRMEKIPHPIWADMPCRQAYVARFATNLFGAAKRVVCNAKVRPRDGTTNTILDTATTGYVEPTVFPCPITNFVNWPRVRAVVSSTGVNASGVAANETYWSGNSSPSEFLNIGAAINAIQGTNSATYGITNCTGGIVLLKDWTTWLGTSVSGNLMDGEILITRHPSKAWDEIGLTDYATDRVISALDILRFKEITIDTSAALVWTTGARGHTWDRSFLKNTTGARVFGALGIVNVTDCLVSNMYSGFSANSSDQCMFSLVSGNRIVGNAGGAVAYTFVGNLKVSTNAFSLSDASASRTGMTKSAPTIIAYNVLPTQDVTYLEIGADSTSPSTWGQAIVQNLIFEFSGTSPSTYGSSYWQSDDIHATNSFWWYNTAVGAKVNHYYDNLGSNAPTHRVQCQILNSVFSTAPIKSDTFGSAPNQSGVRIGNWSCMWCVDQSGNAYIMTGGLSDFSDEEFPGINTWFGNNSPTNYVQWVNERAFNGVTNFVGGGGNYRLQTHSPLHEFVKPYRVMLPWDIEGNARGYSDPPGAWNSSAPRKAAGFFQ